MKKSNHLLNGLLSILSSLGFTSLNGEPITVEAPYPKDFQVLIKMLRQYS